MNAPLSHCFLSIMRGVTDTDMEPTKLREQGWEQQSTHTPQLLTRTFKGAAFTELSRKASE